MIKETDGQPDEEILKMRVLSAGAFVPVELGCITLPLWMCSPTWKLSASHAIGNLWKLPHKPYDQLLTPLPAPLLSGGMEDRANNFKFLIMTWSFW